MSTKNNLEEMIIYDFGNLNPQKSSTDIYYCCDYSESSGCDSCDFCDHGGW